MANSIKFDVTEILRRLGIAIVSDLKRGMQAQKGVDGQPYKPLAPKTVKEKQKISAATAFLRMIRTKDFQNHGFEAQAIGNTLTVKVSDGTHGREIRSMRSTITKHTLNPTKKSAKQIAKTSARLNERLSESTTYREIAEWQNGPKSKLFPTTVNEANNLPSVQRVIPELAREIKIQAGKEIASHIQKLNAQNARH